MIGLDRRLNKLSANCDPRIKKYFSYLKVTIPWDHQGSGLCHCLGLSNSWFCKWPSSKTLGYIYLFIHLFVCLFINLFIYIYDMTREVAANYIKCYFYHCELFALLRFQSLEWFCLVIRIMFSMCSHFVRIQVIGMHDSLIT